MTRDEASTSLLPVGRENLSAGTQVGDYVVEGLLGEGGMATVYVGRHPIIGRRVAIKVIRASLCQSVEAVERFIQEARAANEIGHPNIVDVFTFGTLPDGRCYFVMEWLKGRTLADALDTDGPLDLLDAVNALNQICDGLEAAHRSGVVHRDLKPQNIFFVEGDSGRRQVKLLDFGIAKLIGRPEGRTTQTQPGLTMGTPDYISPEQARGRAIDGAADVYSLGVLAFEMVTGQLPFIADNAADMMAMHLASPPRAPSSVVRTLPPELDKLVGRMLAKEAADRPSPAEVRHDLGELVLPALAAESLLPVRRLFSAATLKRRRPFLVAAVAAAFGAALVSNEGQTDLLPAIVGLASVPLPLPAARPVPPANAASAPDPTDTGHATGELIVRPTPSYALVRVDGEVIGVAGGLARKSYAQPGPHALVVWAPGHRAVRFDVNVEAGTVVVPVRLSRLPPGKAAPPVKAKGAMARSNDLYTIDPWARGR